MISGWINGEQKSLLTIEVTATEISKHFTNWRCNRYRDVHGKLHEQDESSPIELSWLEEMKGVRYFTNIYATEYQLLHSIYMKLLSKHNATDEDYVQIALLESLGISEEVTDK